MSNIVGHWKRGPVPKNLGDEWILVARERDFPLPHLEWSVECRSLGNIDPWRGVLGTPRSNC